ncbi:hypothetical protein J3998_05950 [Thiomicrorhabdus sp. 6S2-11]|uniref:Uncharacterized protein n=1 Tax=Thiomicrorhabdus marina TaxID=2818442 RepID=A0ABS3Q573_9GAMM|nr:hypothetical protein [Thiomicrorhabdus marina]MBO1927114.1 hypothetical protein [Thiomicrorhabdus marina]
MAIPILDEYLLSQFLEMECLGEFSETSVHTLNQLIRKYDLKLFIRLKSGENSFCFNREGDSKELFSMKSNSVFIKKLQFSKPVFSKPRVSISLVEHHSKIDGSRKLLFPFRWVTIPGFDAETQKRKDTKHFGRFSISRFPSEIFITSADYQSYKECLDNHSSKAIEVTKRAKVPVQVRRLEKLEDYLVLLGLDLNDAPFSKSQHGFEGREQAWRVLDEFYHEDKLFPPSSEKTIGGFFDNQNLVHFKANKGKLKKN